MPLHMPAAADSTSHAPTNAAAAAQNHLLTKRLAEPLSVACQHQLAGSVRPQTTAVRGTNGNAASHLHPHAQPAESGAHSLQLQPQPEARDGVCPPVRFGVFTNLKTGSKFAGPASFSAAAQQKMIAFANEELAAPAAVSLSMTTPGEQQQLGSQVDQAQAAVAESAHPAIEGICPQVQFGVFTHLKTGGSFAAPSKLAMAAQQRTKDILSKESLTVVGQALNNSQPNLEQQPGTPGEHADATACKTASQADGERSQVPSGRCTNLAIQGSFAKPSKPVAAAEQRANNIPFTDPAEWAGPADTDHQPPSIQHEQPEANSGKLYSRPVNSTCPKVESGLFTKLKTAGSFAAPSTVAAAAQQRTGDMDLVRPASCLPDPEQQAGKQQERTGADVGKASSLSPDGTCPQVQFGVFTNLKTGGSLAAPGMLSAAAHQRATRVLSEHASMPDDEAADPLQIAKLSAQEAVQQQLISMHEPAEFKFPPEATAALEPTGDTNATSNVSEAARQAVQSEEIAAATGRDTQAHDDLSEQSQRPGAVADVTPSPAEAPPDAAEAQPRKLGSRPRRSSTALSRLAKLAKRSPGVTPHCASAQHAAQHAAQVQHTPAVQASRTDLSTADDTAAGSPSSARSGSNQRENMDTQELQVRQHAGVMTGHVSLQDTAFGKATSGSQVEDPSAAGKGVMQHRHAPHIASVWSLAWYESMLLCVPIQQHCTSAVFFLKLQLPGWDKCWQCVDSGFSLAHSVSNIQKCISELVVFCAACLVCSPAVAVHILILILTLILILNLTWEHR